MKLSILTKVLTAGVLSLDTFGAFNQPSQAQSTTFVCGVSQGKPATLALTPRGSIPVIVWVSEYFSRAGFDPQTRCEDVSNRFQNFYSQGALNFITAGIVNGQQVVCATGASGGACNNSNVLFTLKPRESAARVIQRLNEVRGGASGPLYESTRGRSNSNSVNMNDFLNSAPVDAEASTNRTQPSNPVNPAPEIRQPSSQPAGGNVW
jgi:hypothetical protein